MTVYPAIVSRDTPFPPLGTCRPNVGRDEYTRPRRQPVTSRYAVE